MAKMVNPHKFMSPEWYEWTHNTVLQVHEHFMAWTRTIEFEFVLEVGCGKYGWYYCAFYKSGHAYKGIDSYQGVIVHCRAMFPNPMAWTRENICDIHAGSWCNYDLVFSHAVIDHAPDPDLFIRKSIEASLHYTYIMSYRGYFPAIAEHKIEKNTFDGYCYNDISIPQVRRLLDGLGYKYELHEVATGLPLPEIQSELHIIVEK